MGFLSVTAERPDWIADNAILSFTYDVHVNGYEVDSGVSGTIGASKDTGTSTWNSWGSSFGFLEPGDEITVENFEFNLAGHNIAIRYEDGRGNDITDKMTTGTSKHVAYGGDTILFRPDDSYYVRESTGYTVENGGNIAPGTHDFSVSAKSLAIDPDGDDFVVITLYDLKAAEVNYDITEGDLDGIFTTGYAMSNWSSDYAGDSLVLTFSKINSIKGNTNVSVTAELTAAAAATDIYGYEITLSTPDKALTTTAPVVDATAVPMGYFAVNEDLDLTKAMIEITPIVEQKAVGFIWDTAENTLVVEFTQDVAYVTGKNFDDAFTFTPDGGRSTELVDAEINGKFVTLIFANEDLAAGDSLAIEAGTICDADVPANEDTAGQSAEPLVAGTTEYNY
jgi:hypothetical protein